MELAQETTVVDPEAGRHGQMSEKFRAMGGQVYVDAERVKKANEALG